MHTYYTQVGTSFAHLALAHDLLGEHEQRLLRSMASVNSNGGGTGQPTTPTLTLTQTRIRTLTLTLTEPEP